MAKTKAQIVIEKQEEALKNKLDVTLENLKAIEKEYGLTEDLAKLTFDITKQNKEQLSVTKDIIDKTKSVLDNSKNIAEETLTTVDLHKLERQAIAEGLSDRVKIIQKMKEVQRIQKETNRIVNTQANAFKSIGSSIDGMIKSIPGIGGVLSDVLGVTDITENMSEEFRTAFQQSFDGSSLMRDIFVENSDELIDAGTPTVKKLFGMGTTQGVKFGLGSAAALAAMVGLVRFGMQGGIESMGVKNRFKRMVFGATFDAFKDAFGNLNNASFVSLFRTKVLGMRFGVESTDVAKILRAQTEVSGLTQSQALNVQASIAALSSRRGVLAKDVFSDIANSTELFANFAKDGGMNIGMAAVQAKELGLSLDTVGKVADSVLDFQSSIEGELKASLLIGRQLNLNKARELSLAGDLAGLQREILSLVGSESQFNKMNVIQRKALASALGVSTTELSKLVSGELEIKNSETKQLIGVNQALTAVASIIAGQLAMRGLGRIGSSLGAYSKQTTQTPLITSSDGKPIVSKLPLATERALANNGTVVSASGKFGRKSGYMVMTNQAVRGAGVAAMGASIARFAHPVLFALSFLPLMMPLIKKLVGSNDDISNNTKKSISQELNFPLFTSEALAENKS